MVVVAQPPRSCPSGKLFVGEKAMVPVETSKFAVVLAARVVPAKRRVPWVTAMLAAPALRVREPAVSMPLEVAP